MKWFGLQGVVLLLLFAVTGVAQELPEEIEKPPVEAYKFDFTGGGARAEGMGKAFIAVSDDITAGSWNPAGLYIQEKPVLSFSYGSLSPRGSTKSDVFLGTWEFDHTGSFSNITAVNFVAPIRIKGHHFVGSINYTRNFDEFQGWALSWQYIELFTMYGGELDTAHVDMNLTSEFKGGLNSVNVGFGTRLYKNLTFGTSLNIYTGETVGDLHETIEYDRYRSNYVIGQYVRRLDLATVIDTNKFSGYNATVGFKLEGERFDAGLIVRTPFAMNIKTGRSVYYIQKEGGVDEGRLLPRDSNTLYFDNLLAKYDVPLMVGAGVAYRASDNLLLAADAEYRHFSGGKVDMRDSLRIDPGGHNEEYFTEFNPGWNNVFAVRLGGEYLRETGIGLIPIRAGLGYVPVPAPDEETAGDTSTVVNYCLSLGSGIHWSQIHLDWAYTFTTSKQASNTDTYGLLFFEEQKNRNHHFNFTFTGYF
jgi:long-subunit fatty acid transport protein